MRKLLFPLGAAVLALPVAIALTAGSARAFMQPTLTISRSQAADAAYGPIAGQFAASVAVVPTPSGCGDPEGPAPFDAFCDRIPLEITAPTDLPPTDEFLVTIDVDWDNPTTQNDVDVYLYDDLQIEQRQDPESLTYTQLSSSTQPPEAGAEQVKLFHPDLGKYNLVVLNVTGPNLGYTVKASMAIVRGDEIFELLDPAAPTTESKAPEAAAPIDYSADAGGGAGLAGAIVPPGNAALGEIAVLPDDELETNFSTSTFDQALAPPRSDLARFSAKPPAPASGVAVALSLIALPLLAGIAAVFLLRRRGRLLTP